MNREIRFRGKRIDNGQWVYGYAYEDGNGSFILRSTARPSFDGEKTEYVDDVEWFEVASETIGQFTGYKDENKVEVFEGDDVKFSYPYCTADFYNQPRGYHDGYGSEDGFRGKVSFDNGCYCITEITYTKKFDEEYVLSQLNRGNERELEYFGKIKTALLGKVDGLEVIK